MKFYLKKNPNTISLELNDFFFLTIEVVREFPFPL